ncbi:MAG: alpha-L-fucosidase [Bacteroidales bacterium]
MKIKILLAYIFFIPIGLSIKAQEKCMLTPMEVLPTEAQINYQQMEVIGFLHFTITTFYNKEWGYGNEDPKRFNPLLLDIEQWVKTAKKARLNELILTAKHHDGFCLWPSKYTEHCLKNSPFKNGMGDIVKEFVEACHKYNIKVGLYLSPWDRNHKDYGKSEYITYYKNQLTELLTNYGEINEIWFDGANGGDGYYGGACEKRTIESDYYPWKDIISIVRNLQPNCLIFSDAGPDIRWVGNEDGHCGDTFWSTINHSKLKIGKADCNYLNTGEANGNTWIVGECDVSIRPGWFYHSNEDYKVKTPAQLADIYYQSVGKNGTLLINIPPDSLGRIQKVDSINLVNFRTTIDETFKTNLALGANVKASNTISRNICHNAHNIVDSSNETFWAAEDNITSSTLEIELPKEVEFNRILIQEPIRFGQRICEFEIDIYEDEKWKPLINTTTIGYKRLIRFNNVKSKRIKLTIQKSIGTPAISNFALYLASEKELNLSK